MYQTRLLMAALLAVATSAGSPVRAQGNPSADQIINSLKPGVGMLGGTRGIRPVSPSAEAPISPAASNPVQPRLTPMTHPIVGNPHPAASAKAATSTPSVNLTVQFKSNSADLTPAATRTLVELGRALSSQSLATYHFRIEGHTDTVGAAETNKALSERRAQAVVAFLTGTFKIDATRLEAVGMGEDGLLVQTPPNTPEPSNRRVQVINLGA